MGEAGRAGDLNSREKEQLLPPSEEAHGANPPNGVYRQVAPETSPTVEKTLVVAEPSEPALRRAKSNEYSVDRRLFYMFGMLLCIVYPVIALYMITYEDCPLDALGNEIPFYSPPPECAVDAEGKKLDPDCIEPPKAYARVENILYMCLTNEFVIHASYVVYIKVWALGGRSVEFHKEFGAFLVYYIIEFTFNAAPYHVQTFPAFRKVFPFLYHFTWPLYAAFIVGSTILIPFGLYLCRTTDQYRRAIMFQFPGVVYLGVDIFNRTIFLPFFETMQTEFTLLHLHAIITFFGELALTNFYGSIFLPATQKLTNTIAEFSYNVSYQQEFDIFREEENMLDVVNAAVESDTSCVLSDSDSEGAVEYSGIHSQASHQAQRTATRDAVSGGSPRGSALERSVSFYRGGGGGEGGSTLYNNNAGSSTDGTALGRKSGVAPRRRRTRGSSATLSKRASTFSQLTRRSRVLGSIANQELVDVPPGPYVPTRPDGPDPLEFDKILCWFTMIWDSWRYLLIRTVLLKASSIWLFLLMVVKDFSYSIWHFAYAFTERRILSVIEGRTESAEKNWKQRIWSVIVLIFQQVIVRPFFLTKFLQTTVWRTGTFYEGLNNRRLEYQRRVYEDPEAASSQGSSRLSLKEYSSRRVLGRRPTASEWAKAVGAVASDKKNQTNGFLRSWWHDLVTRLVYNVRKSIRRWKQKDKSKYKHPIQFAKSKFLNRKKEDTFNQAKLLNSGEIEVRYSYANEMVIIRHVPAQPAFSASSDMLVSTRQSDLRRPSNQSVFRRVNASWLSKTVKELQSLIFNRAWPRLLQKFTSSAALLVTEVYAENTVLGLLPSYKEFGFFRTSLGRFRVLCIFVMDIVELSTVWFVQSLSPFSASIKRGYNRFHDMTMVSLCTFNCAAQLHNFALLRYIRFAPICGDKRVLPDNVQQDYLKTLYLIKYWDEPDRG